MKRKVIFHNLTINYSRPPRGLYDFDQNGLFYAYNGDILLTRKQISGSYLDFLNSIGVVTKGVIFMNESELAAGDDHRQLFEDESVIHTIRKYTDKHTGEFVYDSFIVTDAELKLAQTLGIDIDVRASDSGRYGTKSFFRDTARKCGLRIPFGNENIKSQLGGLVSSGKVFLRGFDYAVVKPDEGAAGLGAKIFSVQDLSRINFVSKSGVSINYVKPRYSGNFIVEGWYNNVVRSPSVQALVNSEGEVSIISLHSQIMMGDKKTYNGCYSSDWLEECLQENMKHDTYSFGTALYSNGYYGHFALNGIVLTSGDLLWTEVNPRRVVSSYPNQIIKRICFDQEKIKPYAALRIFKSSWLGKSVSHILDKLVSSLYDPKSERGLVPFDSSLLESQGSIYILAVGEDKNDVTQQLEYVQTL